MGKKELKKQDVIKVWKELDRKSNKPVGLNTVCNKMKIKPYHVTQLFPDGLTEMKRKHGIKIARSNSPYTHDEILEMLNQVVSQYGIPTWKQIKLGGITERVAKRLFKKTDDPKRDLLTAYKGFLKKNKPNSENLLLVENWLKEEDKPKVSSVPITTRSRKKLHVSAKIGGRTYGRPLAFRNMIYEPTDEEGVVLLFGMVSAEIGYSIEGAWHNTFPDCEAKRTVSSKGRQEQVRIEFQHKSRDFVTDGHDPKGCDVIVCWKDNWGKDCPIEVLELSEVIKELPPTKK